MNERILSLLGLARKAGKLELGHDAVQRAVENGKAFLLVTASNISEKSVSGILKTAFEKKIPCLTLEADMDSTGRAVGKYCGVIAVCDKGFAKKISEMGGTAL